MIDITIDDRRSRRFVVPAQLLCSGGLLIYLGLDVRDLPTWLRQAGPWAPIGFVVAASGSKKRPFLLAAAVAVIPPMLWVHGGTATTMIDDHSVSLLRWASVFVSVLAAIAIAVIVPLQAMKRVRQRNA